VDAIASTSSGARFRLRHFLGQIGKLRRISLWTRTGDSSYDVGLLTMGSLPCCSILLLRELGGKVTSGPDPITIGHEGCSQRGEDRVSLSKQPICPRDPSNADVIRCRQ
jgi:hypothetical protein